MLALIRTLVSHRHITSPFKSVSKTSQFINLA